MASPIIGRFKCLCGFQAAHVKESPKCLYHYCPSCGLTGPHARTESQKADMRRNMRPEAAAPDAAPGAAAVTENPTPTPRQEKEPETPTETTTAPKRRGLFS